MAQVGMRASCVSPKFTCGGGDGDLKIFLRARKRKAADVGALLAYFYHTYTTSELREH